MKNVKVFLFFLLLSSACKTHAGLINIEIVNGGGLSASQSSLFDSAVSFWESVLIGTQKEIDVNLRIFARGIAIDGEGKILGQAGPVPPSGVYVNFGIMQFDTADLDAKENLGTLYDIIIHEMAHVIGFGTICAYFGESERSFRFYPITFSSSFSSLPVLP